MLPLKANMYLASWRTMSTCFVFMFNGINSASLFMCDFHITFQRMWNSLKSVHNFRIYSSYWVSFTTTITASSLDNLRSEITVPSRAKLPSKIIFTWYVILINVWNRAWTNYIRRMSKIFPFSNKFISLNAFRSCTKSRTSTVITPITSNDSIQNHFKPPLAT